MIVAQIAPSQAGAQFRGNLFERRPAGRHRPRFGRKEIGERFSRVQQGTTRMPLQLQQSAMVVVCDLANVKWATHRPKTRRVAQQAQRASKFMFQCGWSAASPDLSI
jgi:hypothetical protein